MTPDEDLDRDLRALRSLASFAPGEPSAQAVARVRRLAHDELEAATAGTWLTMASRAWSRVGLPAALAVTVVGYLSWAVTSASALYR
jgi:hypothetical protein